MKEEYFKVLGYNNYPEILKKYENTDVIKRLNGVGQFCGCERTKLYKPKFWFSDNDHGLETAIIVSNFTKDIKAILAARCHDIGTPSFNHCVDFMLNDALKQESSEISIKSLIEKDEKFLSYLKEDEISIDDICDVSKYSIAENKSPKICADRLAGIFHSNYIWLDKCSLNKIKSVYENMIVLEDELGFKSVEDANRFYDLAYNYSIALQENEDQYTMRYIGECLKTLIDKKIIKFEDLYKLSEDEIIIKFQKNIPSWNEFTLKTKLIRCENYEAGYYQRLAVKKRYVDPLCIYKEETVRASVVSDKIKKLVNEYLAFEDSKFYK